MSNILMLSPWLSRAGGGLQSSVRDLALALHRKKNDSIETLGLKDEYYVEDIKYWGDANVRSFNYFGPESFRFSLELISDVVNTKADLIQLHGVWMCPSLAVRVRSIFGASVPLIISPHGMVDPWILNRNRWKKTLVKILWENANWRNAQAFRALNVSEAKAIREVSPRANIVVIPNGVEPASDSAMEEAWELRDSQDPNIIFLGRLHEKKCILELVSAWKKFKLAKPSKWRLRIAGWGSPEYEEMVSRAIFELNDPSIEFLGPVFGESKTKILANASAFILPSKSEGLPVAVLEAAGYGLCPIITPECNLPDFFSNELAINIDASVDGALSGLLLIAQMSSEEIRAKGERARQHVRNNYAWESIASDFSRVHSWILHGESRPDDLMFPPA